jgi:hypothetical protein
METEAIPLAPDGHTDAPEAQVEPDSGLDPDALEADMNTSFNLNVFLEKRETVKLPKKAP